MSSSQRPTPSTRERLLRESVSELTPANSLKAVDESARHLVLNVSIAGTLIGGLGIVSASELANVGFGWALPALSCVAASIALAVWVLIPLRATVKPGRLDLMDGWYADQIHRRGRLIRIAGGLFAASVPLALLPLAARAVEGSDPMLDISIVRDAGKVHAEMHASRLPTDTTITLTVSRENGHVLSRAVTNVGRDGNATAALAAKSNGALGVEAVAKDSHGRTVKSEKLNDAGLN